MTDCSHRILRLSSGQNLRLNFRPGRTGWFLNSPLNLKTLRGRLAPWVCRVTVIHQASGTYFVQPNLRYFLATLRPLSGEQVGVFFDCPQRRDRLRRLSGFLANSQPGRDPRGRGIFLRLALRLEQVDQGGGNLWKHMALDFDELWRRVPLFAMPLGPLQHRVLSVLCGVQGLRKGESH